MRYQACLLTFVVNARMPADLPEVLSASDYVVNILPSTPDTRGLLAGDVFQHCRHKVG